MPCSAELTLLPYYVLRSWNDSLVPLQRTVLEFRDAWEQLAPEATPCPIHFSDDVVLIHKQELQQYTIYQELIASLDKDLGCGGDRWVPEDEYSMAVGTLKQAKSNWDDEGNGGPFPHQGWIVFLFPVLNCP